MYCLLNIWYCRLIKKNVFDAIYYSEFRAQRAHLHTTNHHHSYIFYFLVKILSPTYIGFNSNPTRTNGLISPHRLPPQKHKLTTKQPKTQETTIIMVTSARCSPVASILMVSKTPYVAQSIMIVATRRCKFCTCN